MPEGRQLCQEAKTRLETNRWSTSAKEEEQLSQVPLTDMKASLWAKKLQNSHLCGSYMKHSAEPLTEMSSFFCLSPRILPFLILPYKSFSFGCLSSVFWCDHHSQTGTCVLRLPQAWKHLTSHTFLYFCLHWFAWSLAGALLKPSWLSGHCSAHPLSTGSVSHTPNGCSATGTSGD